MNPRDSRSVTRLGSWINRNFSLAKYELEREREREKLVSDRVYHGDSPLDIVESRIFLLSLVRVKEPIHRAIFKLREMQRGKVTRQLINNN